MSSGKSIKEHLQDVPPLLEEAVNSHLEYYKLFAFSFIAKTAYKLVALFMGSLVVLLALFFFSFAVAFFIGDYLNSIAWGFAYVGFFYLVLLILLYIFRKHLLVLPLLKTLSAIYFKKEQDNENA